MVADCINPYDFTHFWGGSLKTTPTPFNNNNHCLYRYILKAQVLRCSPLSLVADTDI